jgi:hypothetical protein
MNRLSFGPMLLCLLRLQTLRLAAFHGAVMRMRLFAIIAAPATEKEQDRLSVGTAHVGSSRRWRLVVKRSTLRGISSPEGVYVV